MSEAVITFQSQLSGVMETVFKAAMYEITRLVEDSFLEEVTRSREQVESLKRRLKWSESRRKERYNDGDISRCADCGRIGLASEGGETRSSSIKTEKSQKLDKTLKGGFGSCRVIPDERSTQKQEKSETNLSTKCLLFNKVTEEDNDRPAVVVKAEADIKLLLHQEGWSDEKSQKLDTILQGGFESCRVIPDERSTQKQEESETNLSTKAREEDSDRPAVVVKVEADVKPSCSIDHQEGWSDGEDGTGFPSTTKNFHPATQQCQKDWEPGLDQNREQSPDNDSRDPSEPLYQNSYGMEDLAGFERTECVSGNMLDISGMDGPQESPPTRVGEDLGYIGHYEDDMGAFEGAEHQNYQLDHPQNRRGALCSPTDSPSGANIEVSGEFSCLLINEEGYLQDQSVLYPEHVPSASNSRLGFRGQGLHNGKPSLDSAADLYRPSDAYINSLNMGERLQLQVGGRGGRKHNCNQCTMSFPDSSSLKAHKQTHSVGQGSSYSCNQCGKTFTQAHNLKVHQRIHFEQGLHLCSHCGKGFPGFSDLKTHKCTQMGDKPFCCTVCGKKFSRLWNLKLHRRIHTQEKPHRCTMCDKSFTRADILKVHQRTHTGERPYCCALCGLSFKQLDHLKTHQRKHKTDL